MHLHLSSFVRDLLLKRFERSLKWFNLWLVSCQVISHYQCKEQRDAHRFEKISNIIKQFKLSCRSVRLHSCGVQCWTASWVILTFLSLCPIVNWPPRSRAWKCATLTSLPSSTCSRPTPTSWWSCQTRPYVSIRLSSRSSTHDKDIFPLFDC